MQAQPRIVVLGDYEQSLQRFADWSSIAQRSQLCFHHEPLSGETLYEVVKDAEVIALVRDRSPFPAELIRRLPKLKLFPIACTAGGPSKETTAELTWALILAASKNIVGQTQLLQQGQWRNPESVLPMLSGQRLGIIGLGSIGGIVAKVGAAFGMDVVCWSPNMTTERAKAVNCEYVPLDTLLQTSKIVSLHLVVSQNTKGLINLERLQLMRTDSVLVNTARSALIVTADLIEALKMGRPGKAALDVFDMEPIPMDSPLRYAPNLLMSPHLGFIAEPILSSFANGMVDSLTAWLDGKPVPLPFK